MRAKLGSVLVLLLLLSQVVAPAQQAAVGDLRQETFLAVWQKVNDVYFDPTFQGVDWNAVKDKYAPRAAAAKDPNEFYGVLNAMLGELHQSHFAVIPPSAYVGEAEKGGGSHDGESGMEIRVVEGLPTVVRVEPGSAAAKAGIRPGFVIEAVGKTKLADVQDRLSKSPLRAIMRAFQVGRYTESLASGAVGSTVSVVVRDGAGKTRTVALKLQPAKGRLIKFGELPQMYGFAEAKLLPGRVAYLRFNIFMMPLLDDIEAAFAKYRSAKAFVIDLRGNPGGFGGMAIPVAGNFLQKQTLLGTTKLRSGETRLLVYPRPEPFTGPLAFLTDEGSASTSEILVGGMQECGRAITVGGTTLGAVLPSTVEKLPDGSRLQCAFADFRTPKGVLLEGRGVAPNVPVVLTRKALLTGKDPVLDKAVSVLLKRAKAR